MRASTRLLSSLEEARAPSAVVPSGLRRAAFFYSGFGWSAS